MVALSNIVAWCANWFLVYCANGLVADASLCASRSLRVRRVVSKKITVG